MVHNELQAKQKAQTFSLLSFLWKLCKSPCYPYHSCSTDKEFLSCESIYTYITVGIERISGRIISSSNRRIFDGVSGKMYPVSDPILNSVSGIRPSTKALASGYRISGLFYIQYIPSRTLVWTLKACCIYKSLSNTLVIRCVKSRAKMFLYLIFPVLPPGGNPLSAAVSHET